MGVPTDSAVLGHIIFIIFVHGLFLLKIDGTIISYTDDIDILVKKNNNNDI